MFRLIETFTDKDGEEKTISKDFPSKQHVLKQLRRSSPLPNHNIYELNKRGETMGEIAGQVRIFTLVQVEKKPK